MINKESLNGGLVLGNNSDARVSFYYGVLLYLASVFFVVAAAILFWVTYIGEETDLLRWVALTASLFVLASIFGMGILQSRHPYHQTSSFDLGSGKLSEAYRYSVSGKSCPNFAAFLSDKLISDGYDFLGVIENNMNAIMEVYARNLQTKRETVLFIRTELFSMDMLLQHRYLFYSFMASYIGKSNLDWIKRMRTVIFVREMSIPLRILLSTLKIHKKEIRDVQGAQVYALVEEEMKLYTKAYKPDVFLDEVTPWIKKYFLSGGYQEPEHVWKGLDWPDIFFMDWRKKKPQKVNRYDAADVEKGSFLYQIKEFLISDHYRYLGSIENAHEANMDVYNLEEEDSEVTVLVIEADTITEELFLKHRYLLNSFMGKHMGDGEKRWQEGIRVVIGVREMTIELQILLCSQLEYKKPNIYYEKPNSAEVPQVFALVEEEESFYSMGYTPGDFKDEMQRWMKRYIPGIAGVIPEIIWEGLEWEDLERLPMNKEEMIVKVHKALNVWQGGYQEDQRETESDSIKQ